MSRTPSPVRAARAALAALALAATLVGCPLPQPLPDYPPGTITPPRIVVDDSVTQISSPETVVRVPAACTGLKPEYGLDAQIRDANTIEGVEVRWFVNYDPSNQARHTPAVPPQVVTTTAPADPTLRDIDAFAFPPYDYPGITGEVGNAVGALHIVELVVSNGFFAPGQSAPLPYRSPAAGFEIQVYRWVFLNVPESQGCTAGEPGCILCPTAPPAAPPAPTP